MRTDDTHIPTRTKTKTPRADGFIKRFISNSLFCVFLLIALTLVNLTPDGSFTKVKNTVRLILTQNVDIKEELIKLKNMFIPDENITAMTPVSEFINPVLGGSVIKSFGVQDAGSSGFHYGIDIKTPQSANICASASGEITEIATTQELGSYITIKHSDKIYTTYAHLGEIIPNVGENVTKGQPIGRANGENSTIYFEIKQGETYLDPTEFIDFGVPND